MRKTVGFAFLCMTAVLLNGQGDFACDTLATAQGDLKMTFIGHASLLFQYGGLAFYVDPDGRRADFAALPKADWILITHHHGDHFDPQAIAALRRPQTRIVASALCQPLPAGAVVMKNGDKREIDGMEVAAVPAYNVAHKRDSGQPFHPRGEGNGYVLSFPGLRVYVAGDTEDIPEMAGLRDIAVAFLPMNLPYTMTPEMAARAARLFKPRILYPYHFSGTDPQQLAERLRDEPGIEVRVRRFY